MYNDCARETWAETCHIGININGARKIIILAQDIYRVDKRATSCRRKSVSTSEFGERYAIVYFMFYSMLLRTTRQFINFGHISPSASQPFFLITAARRHDVIEIANCLSQLIHTSAEDCLIMV